MLISNPLDSPLFLPTAYRLGGLLGAAAIVILVLARGHLRRLSDDVLFQRWRSWVVIAPIYSLAVLSGELATMLLVSLLILQGLREYAELVELPRTYRIVLLGMGALAAPVAMVSLDAFHLLPPLLLIVATLQPLLFGSVRTGVRHLAFAVLGWGYVAWFLAHMVLIHKYIPGGPGVLLAMGLAVAVSDVGAFAIGKSLGRHAMAPRISPGKTWEGAAGNFLGASLGVTLMGFALQGRAFWVLTLALPLVIGLGSIWGDLVESAIKREFRVKDAGTWLPGFGGLLDRIDSLLLVVPLVYYVMKLV